MYAEGFDAAEVLGGDGSVRDRISTAIRAIFAGWGQRTHLYRAILEARATSPAVRDQWEAFQQSYVDVVAELIVAERAAGVAPDGPDPTRDRDGAARPQRPHARARSSARRQSFDADAHLEAVVHVWLTSIYGRTA